MKFESKEKALGIAAFASLFLPLFFFRKSHNCHYDDCIRIFYDGDLGLCIKNAIDNACLVLSIIWFVLMIGGVMVKELQYIKTAMAFLFGIFLAFLDPGKWMFVISFIPSMIMFAVCNELDKRNKRLNN